MPLIFRKISRRGNFPPQSVNIAYLQPDNWDDFGYKTLFSITVFDDQGQQHAIGSVKIGFAGQTGGYTNEQLDDQFEALGTQFFSLGQDADYYRNLVDCLSAETLDLLLTGLGDVVADPNRLAIAVQEGSFNTSLLRSVNHTSIENQYRRILEGLAPLTEYDFYYEKEPSERYSGLKVEFKVQPNSKPASNIHILIGRNGVGKTTLLNNMVDALLPERGDVVQTGQFLTQLNFFDDAAALREDYFAGVVSVSFSAFDPFDPPENQVDPDAGVRYHYVGLRKHGDRLAETSRELMTAEELSDAFVESLMVCLSLSAKRGRWINSVNKLESDFNFAEMNLRRLADRFDEDSSDDKATFLDLTRRLFSRMSSGHAIVLLSVTKLVETVEEKTLVLLDEPESHLHPPLLSAFTRALSDLLVNRNGVAIIATHSPVVLQEVPKSCVSIIRRTRLVANVERPEIETFAENVGVLTREVFGLEVSKSGFHELLARSVDEGGSYDDIEQEYGSQLGFEGKAILRSLVATRESQAGSSG